MFPQGVRGSIRGYLKDIGQSRDIRFRRRLTVMMLSLLISVSLWLLLKLSVPATETFVFRIEYDQWPETYLPVTLPDSAVEVDMTATGFKLLGFIARGKGSARTLSVSDAGRMSMEADSSWLLTVRVRDLLDLRFGEEQVSEWQMSPSREVLTLRMEPMHERRLPVRLKASVSVAKQFALVGDLRTDPDSVTVRGPRSQVEKLEYVPTEEFSKSDLDESLESTLRLLPGPYPMKADPPSVKLTAIIEGLTEKVLDVPLPSTAIGVDGDFVVLPARVEVHLSMPLSLFDKVSVSDVLLELRRKGTGAYLSVSAASIPAGTSLLRIHPAEVEFYMSQ